MRKLSSLLPIKFSFWQLTSLGIFFSTLCLLSGCQPPVDPTNPFDPETNVAVQDKGEIRGQVELPEYLQEDTYTRVSVSLRKQRELDEPFKDESLDENGQFSFEELRDGRYRLEITLSGFNTERFSLDMGIGEFIDLGTI